MRRVTQFYYWSVIQGRPSGLKYLVLIRVFPFVDYTASLQVKNDFFGEGMLT